MIVARAKVLRFNLVEGVRTYVISVNKVEGGQEEGYKGNGGKGQGYKKKFVALFRYF